MTDANGPRPRGGTRRGMQGGTRSRGQSTTLEYTLSLAIASLVVMGLVSAAGGFVDDRRQEVVRTELQVVGEQLASELVAADRLVESGAETNTVRLERSLPEEAAGTGYNVDVTRDGSTTWLNLTAMNADVSVAVRLETATPVAETAVQGGDVTVTYDGTRLEVSS